MIPIPKVAKVAPRCYQCGEPNELILGDGPVICRTCIRIGVRLADASIQARDWDHKHREGQW